MKKYLLILIPVLFSCKIQLDKKNVDQVTITNWNVQTFFDANNDGIEYKEFRKNNGKWNEEFYTQRLERLCGVIDKFDSDIFVMEELENEKIIFDISNALSKNVWFKNKVYNYAAFEKTKKTSIGCGMLSKYPITKVKTHSMDIKTEKEKQPSMRPIMEVTINKDGKELTVFINHWKSKSGGKEKTEKWRDWQEVILSRQMQKCKEKNVIAVGDFNRDVKDFCRDKNDNLFFRSFELQKKLAVFSAWDNYTEEKGSYFFRDSWERIDHFFALDKNLINEFGVSGILELEKNDGTPNKYQLFTHSGYSDHFPIWCAVELK